MYGRFLDMSSTKTNTSFPPSPHPTLCAQRMNILTPPPLPPHCTVVWYPDPTFRSLSVYAAVMYTQPNCYSFGTYMYTITNCIIACSTSWVSYDSQYPDTYMSFTYCNRMCQHILLKFVSCTCRYIYVS